MKVCSRCKNPKDELDFCKDSKSKCGLQSQCKSCKAEQIGLYYKTPEGKAKQKIYDKSGKRTAYSLARYYRNKIAFNMARSMRRSLKSDKQGVSWSKLVNYSLLELKHHLETKFVDGMSWENYGSVWHIDHIRPVASFNITSKECDDFKTCWELNNLQPLFALDNLKKSNKILSGSTSGEVISLSS